MIINEITLRWLNIVFFVFSIIGILSSAVLFFSPATFSKIEKLLNRRYNVDSHGTFVDTKVDIEYIFFNHHIITALWLMVLSGILLAADILLIDIDSMEISKWIIIFAFFKYFFGLFSFTGVVLGACMLVTPLWTFRFLRGVNRYVYSLSTDNIEQLMQSDVLERNIYVKYNHLTAVVVFLFSAALLVIMLKQYFFK
jgi:hypothetical protein